MRTIEIKFTEEQRDEMVKSIIQDAVMIERLKIAMDQVQRIFNPREEAWEAEQWFSSVHTAFPLMGFPSPKTIEEEEKINPITGILQKIFLHAVQEDLQRDPKDQLKADVLAKGILKEWKRFLSDVKFGFRSLIHAIN